MRISAGAVIRRANQILIVKPTYREDWLLPGGRVEAGESPRAACAREVLEETGLQIEVTRLLCVDCWTAGTETHDQERRFRQPEDELIFLFDGGCLTDAQVSDIHLPADELSDYALPDFEQALRMLAPFYAERLVHALAAAESGRPVYLEAGRLIG